MKRGGWVDGQCPSLRGVGILTSLAGPSPPDTHTGRRGVTLPRSVAAGRDSPPVVDGVRDGLGPRRAVAERQQAVTDLAADAVLLDMIPVPERVLVFDLGSLLAGERDRPVGRVDAGEGN